MLPASAAQQGFDELSGGVYRGRAISAGPATVDATGGAASLNGNFNTNLNFTIPIPSGPTSGTWDLTGNTSWTIEFGNLNGQSRQNHRANGAIEGDRQRLTLAASQITSTGLIVVDLIGEQPVDNEDPIGPLDLTVTRILCDDVTGEWEFSWNTEMLEGGFSPTFRGTWNAHRDQSPTDEQTDVLFEGIFDLLDDLSAALFVDQIEAFTNESEIDGVPILPFDAIWDLLERAVALVNELSNLSVCDRALLGDDEVQEYTNLLTGTIRILILVLLENLALQGDIDVTAEAMLELTAMAASVGGVGEGAVRDALGEAAQATELGEAIGERVDIIVNNLDSAVDDPVGFVGDRAEVVFDFVFGGGE